jgi:hypothetical protein
LLLTPGELEWFADLKGLGYRRRDRPKLTHFHYRILAKSARGVRLIEAPKPRLKALQRQILSLILHQIPPHSAAHGFRKGRSIRTFVAPHVGQGVVLRMDLRDFFPSISGARIQAFFRTVGYPESVADLLGGICSNATPSDVWNHRALDIDPVNCAKPARYMPGRICRRARPHRPRSPICALTVPIAGWLDWRNGPARSIPAMLTIRRSPAMKLSRGMLNGSQSTPPRFFTRRVSP